MGPDFGRLRESIGAVTVTQAERRLSTTSGTLFTGHARAFFVDAGDESLRLDLPSVVLLEVSLGPPGSPESSETTFLKQLVSIPDFPSVCRFLFHMSSAVQSLARYLMKRFVLVSRIRWLVCLSTTATLEDSRLLSAVRDCGLRWFHHSVLPRRAVEVLLSELAAQGQLLRDLWTPASRSRPKAHVLALHEKDGEIVQLQLERAVSADAQTKLLQRVSILEDKLRNLTECRASLEDDLFRVENEKLLLSREIVDVKLQMSSQEQRLEEEKLALAQRLLQAESDLVLLNSRLQVAAEESDRLRRREEQQMSEHQCLQTELSVLRENLAEAQASLDAEVVRGEEISLELLQTTQRLARAEERSKKPPPGVDVCVDCAESDPLSQQMRVDASCSSSSLENDDRVESEAVAAATANSSSRMAEQCDSWRSALEAKEAENAELQAAVRERVADLERSQRVVVSLQGEVEGLLQDLNASKRLVLELQQTAGSLSDAAQEQRGKEKNSEATRELDSLRSSIRQLEEDLGLALGQKEKIFRDLRESQRNEKDLLAEVSALKARQEELLPCSTNTDVPSPAGGGIPANPSAVEHAQTESEFERLRQQFADLQESAQQERHALGREVAALKEKNALLQRDLNTERKRPQTVLNRNPEDIRAISDLRKQVAQLEMVANAAEVDTRSQLLRKMSMDRVSVLEKQILEWKQRALSAEEQIQVLAASSTPGRGLGRS